MAMYEDNDYRFIVACFSKADVGRLFNVAGHAMAGLMDKLCALKAGAASEGAADEAAIAPELLEAAGDFLDYRTKDAVLHARIARWPVVVLKTDRQNLLRRLYLAAKERDVPANPVVMEMVDENTEKQLANTAAVTVDEAQFVCVALFEKNGTLNDLTKKFSLMR